MKIWCRSAFGAAAILALCSACTSYTVYPTFAKVTDYPQHAHQKEQIVLLMSDEVPADPYDSVGQVEVTRSDWASNQDMFDAMRDLAVKYGFGGIEVDDSNWTVKSFGILSEWGHRPPAQVKAA